MLWNENVSFDYLHAASKTRKSSIQTLLFANVDHIPLFNSLLEW